MTKYSTISLPKELYDKLQELIEKKPDLGYSSVADFCKEAIRLHVEAIKRELREDFFRKIDVPGLFKKIESISAVDRGTYGEAFERLKEMAFLATGDFKIKDCNEEFLSLLGYLSKDEVIGRNIGEFFEADNLKKRMRKGEKDIEAKAIRKDGKKLDVLLSIGLLDGKVKYIGVARDITVRKYVEEKERRARQLYEYLINELCDTVVVVQDGKIKFVNKEVTSGGYEQAEVVGKNFLDFIAEEDRERIMENYKKLLEDKLEEGARKYKLICKNGEKREAELRSRSEEGPGSGGVPQPPGHQDPGQDPGDAQLPGQGVGHRLINLWELPFHPRLRKKPQDLGPTVAKNPSGPPRGPNPLSPGGLEDEEGIGQTPVQADTGKTVGGHLPFPAQDLHLADEPPVPVHPYAEPAGPGALPPGGQLHQVAPFAPQAFLPHQLGPEAMGGTGEEFLPPQGATQAVHRHPIPCRVISAHPLPIADQEVSIGQLQAEKVGPLQVEPARAPLPFPRVGPHPPGEVGRQVV